jgi:hypothetical protein
MPNFGPFPFPGSGSTTLDKIEQKPGAKALTIGSILMISGIDSFLTENLIKKKEFEIPRT